MPLYFLCLTWFQGCFSWMLSSVILVVSHSAHLMRALSLTNKHPRRRIIALPLFIISFPSPSFDQTASCIKSEHCLKYTHTYAHKLPIVMCTQAPICVNIRMHTLAGTQNTAAQTKRIQRSPCSVHVFALRCGKEGPWYAHLHLFHPQLSRQPKIHARVPPFFQCSFRYYSGLVSCEASVTVPSIWLCVRSSCTSELNGNLSARWWCGLSVDNLGKHKQL